MASKSGKPRLAILIDGENIDAAFAARIFKTAATMGELAVRRLYGNVSNTRVAKWITQSTVLRLVHRTSFGYTENKNSSDIALCIDAMDLLHTNRLDGFCIVSSDSDFTHLALRVREHGLDAYGIGEKDKYASAYRETFDGFVELAKPVAVKKTPAPLSQPPSIDLALLRKTVTDVTDKKGWARLDSIENRLKQLGTAFNPSSHSGEALVRPLRATGLYEIDQTAGRAPRARLKPKPD